MNDWPWPVVLVLVLPAAIGHLCHFVLLINVVSGLGYPESAMDRVRFCTFRRALGLVGSPALDASAATRSGTGRGRSSSYAILCVISGVIVLPLTSLYLALRKPPEGITGSVPDDRPGACERKRRLDRRRPPFLVVAIATATIHSGSAFASGR